MHGSVLAAVVQCVLLPARDSRHADMLPQPSLTGHCPSCVHSPGLRTASAEIIKWKGVADELLAAKQLLTVRARELEEQRNQVRHGPLHARCSSAGVLVTHAVSLPETVVRAETKPLAVMQIL